MTARYRLIDDDPRFGLHAGDVLVCEPYRLDPDLKLTVLHRESDGFDPDCNVYRCRVRRCADATGPERNIRCDVCGTEVDPDVTHVRHTPDCPRAEWGIGWDCPCPEVCAACCEGCPGRTPEETRDG